MLMYLQQYLMLWTEWLVRAAESIRDIAPGFSGAPGGGAEGSDRAHGGGGVDLAVGDIVVVIGGVYAGVAARFCRFLQFLAIS